MRGKDKTTAGRLLLMISSASSPLAEGAEAQVIDQIRSLQIGAETLFLDSVTKHKILSNRLVVTMPIL